MLRVRAKRQQSLDWILSLIHIWDNSKIGAGSVVIEEVPPNCTVVGVPGRVVKRDNIRTPQDDMDQVHLPDPVKEDITVLQHENAELVNLSLIHIYSDGCYGSGRDLPSGGSTGF